LKKYDSIKLICHDKNEGRGKAVKDGIMTSSGKIVGFIDIDLEIAIHNIIPLIIKIKEGYHVATGRRFYKPSGIQRWITSRVYSWLVRKLLKVDLKDTETGCKFFNRKSILPILDKTKDPHWFWDTEIMVLSYYQGLKIIEYNVLFARRPEVPSTVRIIRDSYYSFFKLLKFRKALRNS
jgi:glycosyltransferase involved in cell wall biosynthesis